MTGIGNTWHNSVTINSGTFCVNIYVGDTDFCNATGNIIIVEGAPGGA